MYIKVKYVNGMNFLINAEYVNIRMNDHNYFPNVLDAFLVSVWHTSSGSAFLKLVFNTSGNISINEHCL